MSCKCLKRMLLHVEAIFEVMPHADLRKATAHLPAWAWLRQSLSRTHTHTRTHDNTHLVEGVTQGGLLVVRTHRLRG